MMENQYKDKNYNADVSNIKTLAELEKVVNKARKLGADAIGTYEDHTAVRIAGRWYVPFLRKDQTPDDDPCLRPVSSFTEENTSKNSFGGDQTNQSFNENEFSKKNIDTDKKVEKDSTDKNKSKSTPNREHGFSPLSSDDEAESDDTKRGWKKSRKKLL